MEDKKIIELYVKRSEHASVETENKCSRMILGLTAKILHNRSDAEECENDTYLGCWNTIPPQLPLHLKAYVMKIARNLAIKRYEYLHAAKRDIDQCIPYEELNDYFASQIDFVDELAKRQMIESLNGFLEDLSAEARKVFLLRYWHFLPVKEIMAECGMSQSKVESMLFRTRKKLKMFMERSYYEYQCSKAVK